MPRLVLGCEEGGIGLDEGLDLGHGTNQALHLATVQRDREASKAVDAERTLLADLEGDGLRLRGSGKDGLHIRKLLFEGFVLLGKVREDGHRIGLSGIERQKRRTTPLSHGSGSDANHGFVIEVLCNAAQDSGCSAISGAGRVGEWQCCAHLQ